MQQEERNCTFAVDNSTPSLERIGAGTSKKNRPTSANANALKLSCELLRFFMTGCAVSCYNPTIAEAEGGSEIKATHLERILPRLLRFLRLSEELKQF